jgi:hypothetical protein
MDPDKIADIIVGYLSSPGEVIYLPLALAAPVGAYFVASSQSGRHGDDPGRH